MIRVVFPAWGLSSAKKKGDPCTIHYSQGSETSSYSAFVPRICLCIAIDHNSYLFWSETTYFQGYDLFCLISP